MILTLTSNSKGWKTSRELKTRLTDWHIIAYFSARMCSWWWRLMEWEDVVGANISCGIVRLFLVLPLFGGSGRLIMASGITRTLLWPIRTLILLCAAVRKHLAHKLVLRRHLSCPEKLERLIFAQRAFTNDKLGNSRSMHSGMLSTGKGPYHVTRDITLSTH